MDELPYSLAAERNSGPILSVLRQQFARCEKVLEIGSGTGQHAVAMAEGMPHLAWQTSDLVENHNAIEARVCDSQARNVYPPLLLDVRDPPLTISKYDGVFSANTAHIMNPHTVAAMFEMVGHLLIEGGAFCLYGPFRQNGKLNSASNESFDKSLRARGADMAIRDLETLDELAENNGLKRNYLFAMPANNQFVIWQKK